MMIHKKLSNGFRKDLNHWLECENRINV